MPTKISAQQVVAPRSPITRGHSRISNTAPALASAVVNSVCMNLTARQHEVLVVLMQGKSNKGICRVLNLAEATVKNHISAILKSLNVTSRTEAVIKVTDAAIRSRPYTYTISGYSTFTQHELLATE